MLSFFSLGLPSTSTTTSPTTTLLPASLPTTASVGALLLNRSQDLEPDAGTANLSTPFLGAVLGTNCQPDTTANGSTSWVVDGLPGGGYPRCYTAVTPTNYTRKLPVVIFLVGIGGPVDGVCGPCCDDEDDVHSFTDLATNVSKTGGFAVVCPEPLRFTGSSDGKVWASYMWVVAEGLERPAIRSEVRF